MTDGGTSVPLSFYQQYSWKSNMLDPASAFIVPKTTPLHPDKQITLHDMLWCQHRHDWAYHRDICTLGLMGKLNHLNNHLNKYISSIQRRIEFKDNDYSTKALDGVIVCISALSALAMKDDQWNKNVMDFICEATIGRLEDVTFHIADNSKVLEGWDHLEDINYRERLKTNFIELLKMFMCLYYRSTDVQLVVGYNERLDCIQRKNMFYKHMCSEHGIIRLNFA